MAFPDRLDLAHCTLRAWRSDDAPALAMTLGANDAHLRAWTPWVVDGRVPGQSLAERLARHADDFAVGREWVYGIFAPDETEVLGGCGLYARVGATALEIGYWLAAGSTGQGLATESATALTALAFSNPAIERAEIHCDPRNAASVRIPQRLGYRLETAAEGEFGEPGAWPGVVDIWVLTREEYTGGKR
ncbi:MAG TPA: GNAT family N-acetyltransferase [Gemmatimonadaceae bacterium]|nr:GNAT family N-acetyltransferase [Gemmatimonadaceae bacterium]